MKNNKHDLKVNMKIPIISLNVCGKLGKRVFMEICQVRLLSRRPYIRNPSELTYLKTLSSSADGSFFKFSVTKPNFVFLLLWPLGYICFMPRYLSYPHVHHL